MAPAVGGQFGQFVQPRLGLERPLPRIQPDEHGAFAAAALDLADVGAAYQFLFQRPNALEHRHVLQRRHAHGRFDDPVFFLRGRRRDHRQVCVFQHHVATLVLEQVDGDNRVQTVQKQFGQVGAREPAFFKVAVNQSQAVKPRFGLTEQRRQRRVGSVTDGDRRHPAAPVEQHGHRAVDLQTHFAQRPHQVGRGGHVGRNFTAVQVAEALDLTFFETAEFTVDFFYVKRSFSSALTQAA